MASSPRDVLISVAILLMAGCVPAVYARNIEPECKLDLDGRGAHAAAQVIVPRNNAVLTAAVLGDASLRRLACLAGDDLCVYELPSDCPDARRAAATLSDNIYACAKPQLTAKELAPRRIGTVLPNVQLELVRSDEPTPVAAARGGADEHFSQQHSLRAMGAEDAWLTVTKSPLITAILDNGVQLTHADLAEQLVPGVEIPCTGMPCDGGSRDPRFNHGTAMAGIVAAARNHTGMIGTAWNTRLLSIKISGHNDPAFEAAAVAGMRCALHRGARIINLSYSSDKPTDALAAALRQEQREFLLVVPTGNRQKDIGKDKVYPAQYGLEHVMVVMSHTDHQELASNSGWGGNTDIAAPGRALHTAFCKQGSCYSQSSNTSNAAAFVSGAAALLWSRHEDWTATEIKRHILNTADNEPKLAQHVKHGRRLNLATMMHPVTFKVSHDRKVRRADLHAVELGRAFPPGMCSGQIDWKLVTAGHAQASIPTPNSKVEIVATCKRVRGGTAMVTSVPYTVVD